MTNAPGQRVPTWLRVGLATACAPVMIAIMVRRARASITTAAPSTAARPRRGRPPAHDHTSTAAVDATTPTGPFSPARLRGHLDGAGRSRAEVATRIGRTEAEVTSYEDGAAQPPPRVRAALAAMLGVPIDDLGQKRHDWAADYVDTVAGYCQPETDAELDAVAAALRQLDAIADRHRRAAAGPTPALTVVRGE